MFAQRQRVEVMWTRYGVTTFEVATVVDLPHEDTVRVRFDSTDRVTVVDRDSVLDIPTAVGRHITRLIEALGAVSDDELLSVAAELQHRLGHDDLIAHARMVAAATAEIAEGVRGARQERATC